MTADTKRTYFSSLIFTSSLLAAFLVGGCGSKDDNESAGVGESCDSEEDNPCADDLECTKSGEDDAEICTWERGAACDPEDDLLAHGCGPNATCAEKEDGDFACFGRVVLRGRVSDTSDSSAIEGARVLSLNELGFAVTDVAVTDADGIYELDIPTVRKDDGSPSDDTFTLNASAMDYLPFPQGVRVALPISADEAKEEDDIYVLSTALTDIGLIPMESGDRLMVSGKISALEDTDDVAGVLVVATGASGTVTAITDKSGNYSLFNLDDGDYELKAYGGGVQIEGSTVSVSGEDVGEVDLAQVDGITTTVSGSIQIVNASGSPPTSIILVVEDTFDELAARGEVPRGLRAPESGPVSITGEFEIEGVPEGKYVVLAAYENDDLVRDPDTNISGTDFVHIEVSANEETMAMDESFKITEALAITSPGADGPEAVSEKPELIWADDSSEDWYDLRVYDAFGDEVWNSLMIPGVSGSDTVSVQYEGPLDPGMYYQFRVSSWRQPGKGDAAPISATEDLRGVFFLPAPEADTSSEDTSSN